MYRVADVVSQLAEMETLRATMMAACDAPETSSAGCDRQNRYYAGEAPVREEDHDCTSGDACLGERIALRL